MTTPSSDAGPAADAYVTYLRAGDAASTAALADALAAAGYRLESDLLRTGRAVGSVGSRAGPWAGRTVWSGSHPPRDAGVGDLWFDPVEVVTMVLVGWPPDDEVPTATPEGPYSWVALRPVANWQYAAFLALASVGRRDVQIPPPLPLLDRARILAGPDVAPVVGITHGEADLYARWFGKRVAHWLDWEGADASLDVAALGALRDTLASEWAGHLDEDARVTVTPDTIGDDPRDDVVAERVHDEFDLIPDVTFRTAVTHTTGLADTPVRDLGTLEDVVLLDVLRRDG